MKHKNLLYTVVVFVIFLFFAAVNTSHSMLLTELIEAFGLTSSQQGGATTIQNFGSFLSLVFIVLLTGRIRKPRLYVLSLVAMSLALLPMSFAGSYAGFTLACGAMGLAMGFVDTLSSSMIADMYQGKKAKSLMCVLHAIFGVGSITSSWLIGLLQNRGVHWNSVYLGYGLLGLAFALLILYPSFLQLRRTDLPKESLAVVRKADVRELLSQPLRRSLLIIILLYGTAQGGLAAWLNRYVDVGLGGSLGSLSMILLWIGLTISRLSSSVLNIPALTYVKVGGFASAVLAAIGIFSGNPIVMTICAALYTLFCGSVVPVALAQLCGGYRGNSLFATTAVMACNYVSQAIGPALIGMVEGFTSMRGGMCVVVVSMVLCSLVAALAQRRMQRENQAG